MVSYRAFLVAFEARQVEGGGAVVVCCRDNSSILHQQSNQFIVTWNGIKLVTLVAMALIWTVVTLAWWHQDSHDTGKDGLVTSGQL